MDVLVIILSYFPIMDEQLPIFKVHTAYQPAGDQPVAIEALSSSIKNGERYVTLEGVVV